MNTERRKRKSKSKKKRKKGLASGSSASLLDRTSDSANGDEKPVRQSKKRRHHRDAAHGDGRGHGHGHGHRHSYGAAHEAHAAAVSIQAVVRGFLVRKRMSASAARRELASAAMVVQVAWRAHAAVRMLRRLRARRAREGAAVVIQAAWRGYALRALLARSPQPPPLAIPPKARMAMVEYLDEELLPAIDPSLHDLLAALQHNWDAIAARKAEIADLAAVLADKEESIRRERENNPSYIPPPLEPGELSTDEMRAALVMDVEPLHPSRTLASFLCESSILDRRPTAPAALRRAVSQEVFADLPPIARQFSTSAITHNSHMSYA